MAFRTWGRLLLVALGVGVLAGAGQLGFAYGFGIVRFARTFDATTVSQWTAQLAWVSWFTMVAAVVGAVIADRLARRYDYRPTLGTRLALAAAAALGAGAVAPLSMQPARAAQVASVDPVLAAGLVAGLGALVGFAAAVAALHQSPASWNVALVTGGIWLLALISVMPSLGPTDPLPAVRLGVPDPTWLSAGTTQRLAVVTMPALALVAGALTGALARWRNHSTLVVATAGAVGPAMLALAYLAAGPGDSADKYQAAPYWGALVATGAGALGSVLAAVMRWPLTSETATQVPLQPTEILQRVRTPQPAPGEPSETWANRPTDQWTDPASEPHLSTDLPASDRLSTDLPGGNRLSTDLPGGDAKQAWQDQPTGVWAAHPDDSSASRSTGRSAGRSTEPGAIPSPRRSRETDPLLSDPLLSDPLPSKPLPTGSASSFPAYTPPPTAGGGIQLTGDRFASETAAQLAPGTSDGPESTNSGDSDLSSSSAARPAPPSPLPPPPAPSAQVPPRAAPAPLLPPPAAPSPATPEQNPVGRSGRDDAGAPEPTNRRPEPEWADPSLATMSTADFWPSSVDPRKPFEERTDSGWNAFAAGRTDTPAPAPDSTGRSAAEQHPPRTESRQPTAPPEPPAKTPESSFKTPEPPFRAPESPFKAPEPLFKTPESSFTTPEPLPVSKPYQAPDPLPVSSPYRTPEPLPSGKPYQAPEPVAGNDHSPPPQPLRKPPFRLSEPPPAAAPRPTPPDPALREPERPQPLRAESPSAPKPQPKPEPTPHQRPDPTPDQRSEPTPERQSDLRPERQSDPRPERQSDLRTEEATDLKVEESPEPQAEAKSSRPRRGLFRRNRSSGTNTDPEPPSGADAATPQPPAQRGRGRTDRPVPATDEEYVDWVSGLGAPIAPEDPRPQDTPRRTLRSSGRHHAD
ncbi:hypothetical protein OG792_03265 [Micromonospora sp. NBC_01699]|uniref:hypothetical protein n=1 Tax=Micromonospora sp. NBC_01699 TaxID=2975984 RepID=UPI002E2D8E89|nr:hypothetical protein [Micromonospora sp. NBC_01699]